MTIATDYEIPQEILNGLSPAVLAALLEEQAENDDNKFSLDELVTNERNTELELVKSEEKDNQFRGQESHLGGIHGPSIPHYNVTGRDLYGRKFKKHLFITEDPNDLRLARLDSYNTNHPSE